MVVLHFFGLRKVQTGELITGCVSQPYVYATEKKAKEKMDRMEKTLACLSEETQAYHRCRIVKIEMRIEE